MYLVTGGAGFIGSNLLSALERRGIGPLVVSDRLRQADKWRNLAKRELLDIVAPERLFDFLEGQRRHVQAVLHFGAISSTTETDADLILSNNFHLSAALWTWCARNGVRFLYASSAATYGGGEHGFDDDASPGHLAKLRPLNPYGWSKHMFDRRVARMLAEGAPVPPQWAGLKFFNVYGPNEYHKGAQQSVVAHVHRQIAGGGKARLFRSHHPDYADGGQLRDFVSVDDTVAVMLWLLDHPEVNGLFNIGTGQARSFLDLAHAVYAALDRPPEIEWVDTPVAIRDKYQYFTQANMDRLRAAGFGGAFTPLEAGVAAYVRGHLAAADPYL